jgi:ribonuclease HI
MPVPAPHFLLTAQCAGRRQAGDWRFVLETADGRRQLEVEDAEPAVGGDRLELLAVVRGLEAIDQPANVTLLTGSHYIKRGLSYGLDDWRSNNWQWERHGEMVPVKNSDLWQRLDRALQIHRVDCKLLRFDQAHSKQAATIQIGKSAESGAATASETSARPEIVADAAAATESKLVQTAFAKPQSPRLANADLSTTAALKAVVSRPAKPASLRFGLRRAPRAIRRWFRDTVGNWRLSAAQFGTAWLPKPWLE